MSIIQDIRDKYAKVAVVAIALALIGFILTDYFSGRARGGGQGSNNLGSVNGTTIKADDFARKVEQAESQMRQQGYTAGGLTAQAVDNVWGGEINSILLEDEADKLGLAIGKKELGDILYGSGAPQDLKQQLSDENGYDPIRAKQKVDAMMKDKNVSQEQKDNFNNYVEQLKQVRLTEKLNSLMGNSLNYPRWYVEKQNADQTLLGKASIVREFYSAVPDSSVKVEDKEIADYIRKNKDLYKQEESRSIAYVSFSAAPTAEDSLAIQNQLMALKPEMDTTADIVGFLARNGITNYADSYIPADQFGDMKDSIAKLVKNQVHGPIVYGQEYVLLKLMDTKVLPDTVKVRHILISTTQRDQNGQTTQVRDTTSAFKLADSIRTEIARGANFDSLAAKLSEDPGSKDKGGVYEGVYYGQMVPEFNDFIFMNPVGSKDIVKTDFGYHYIEVMQQKGSGAAYKIARLPLPIMASSETDNRALEEANQFAADSRDMKGFDELFEKTQKPKGRVKNFAQNLTPIAAQVSGLGFSRPLVRSAYDAKLGEVLKPERINDAYIVAVVTNVYEEGTKDVETVRTEVEPLLRNKKKAGVLKSKIGKVTTLEAAAAALGNKQIEPIDSVRINATASLGYEPRVSGAIFNPANKGKVVPEVLEGVSGVYVVRVENVTATASTSGDISQQRNQLYMQNKANAGGQVLVVLKNSATIKDKRATRY
jgi:peptidyl-prolyl cis-trans isomerase D